jgi:hypothetical protein
MTEHGVQDGRWHGRIRKLAFPLEDSRPNRWDPRFNKKRIHRPVGRLYEPPKSKIRNPPPPVEPVIAPKPEKKPEPPPEELRGAKGEKVTLTTKDIATIDVSELVGEEPKKKPGKKGGRS